MTKTTELIYDKNSNGEIHRIRKELPDKRFLCLELEYDKGEYNYFSGERVERGYYLYFTIKEIDNNFYIYAPMHDENFKVFIKKAKRYSGKTYDKIMEKVVENADKLMEFYKTKDFKVLRKIFPKED